DGQHGRPARGRHLGLRCELAGIPIHGEGDDLVLVLQANVQRIWHLLASFGLPVAGDTVGRRRCWCQPRMTILPSALPGTIAAYDRPFWSRRARNCFLLASPTGFEPVLPP